MSELSTAQLKAAHDHLRKFPTLAAVYITSDDNLFESRNLAELHANSTRQTVTEVLREESADSEGEEAMAKATELHKKRLAALVKLGAQDDGEFVRLGKLAHASGEQGLSAMDKEEFAAFIGEWAKEAKALIAEEKAKKKAEDAAK